MYVRNRPAWIPALFLLAFVSCGGDDAVGPTEPGTESEGNEPTGNEAPVAAIDLPTDGASFGHDEEVVFEGSGTDPEDGTLDGESLAWASDVDGALGTGASLARDDLSAGAHTITLTATDNAGGTGTDDVDIEVAAPPPPDVVPFEEGRLWRYTEESESTVCAWSTGCSTTTFVGRHFVRVEREVFYEGRTSWRVRVYSLRDDAPTHEHAFETSLTYLSQDETGLRQWVSGPDAWRRVLSTSSPMIFDGTFFLVDGPPRDPDRRLTVDASSATVPYGSFTTFRVGHEYRETGQYATEDIFDYAHEHYAPEVGLVSGGWDYHYDDNDPRGTDVDSEGAIELTHMDTGPFPVIVSEREPNDDHTTDAVLSAFSIGEGDIRMGDSGVIIDDADVGCTLSDCVYPDATGQKRIQDWFRLDVTQGGEVRIELDFPGYDPDTAVPNDLDLYLFGADGSGGIVYLDRSVGPPGGRERLVGTVQVGTYFLGVQAWETPGGTIPYWLASF